MKQSDYAVIILAAGYSSRMGSFKPLIKLNGITIVEHLIDIYRKQLVDIFLVMGWKSDELLGAIDHSDITPVLNADYPEGMFSSVKAGLKVGENFGYKGVFIQPVDIPLVLNSTIKELIEYHQKLSAQIIYPTFNSRRGHPTLISTELVQSILNWKGEGGLKGYFLTHEKWVRELEVQDSNILFDIDTPLDIPELKQRYRKRESSDGMV